MITMLNDFIHLFFPAHCLTCPNVLVAGEKLLCTACFNALPQTNCHTTHDNIVARKLYGRVPIRYAMALYYFRKGNKVQKLLHQLKYAHQPMIGMLLGRRYGMLLKEVHLDQAFDLIVPVPLHSAKLRKRGYNQSNLFAKGLSESLHIPWSEQALQRVTNTQTQTKKNKEARLKNVADAFYVTDTQAVQGKNLLVVDDIITTGATLEACILPLLMAGIQEVSITTIAMAE